MNSKSELPDQRLITLPLFPLQIFKYSRKLTILLGEIFWLVGLLTVGYRLGTFLVIEHGHFLGLLLLPAGSIPAFLGLDSILGACSLSFLLPSEPLRGLARIFSG